MDMAAEEDLPLYEAEAEVMGATHADIGALLAERWNLPSELHEAILGHHNVGEGGVSQLGDCVFAANQVSKKLSFGAAGDFTFKPLPASIQKRFSMDLDGLIKDMPTLDEEVERARVFIKLGEAS